MFIFQLQEVGSIIGKKGEIVKRFREEVQRYFITNLHINASPKKQMSIRFLK